MKCSNCSNDMVQSRAGWLCLSCGHIELNPAGTVPAADLTISTGRESHDQMRASAAAAAAASDAPADATADGASAKPAEDATPVIDTSTDAASTDNAVVPPPPVAAAPWETAPAADTPSLDSSASSEPAKTADATKSDEAPVTKTDEAAPTSLDLEAVENVVAEVEEAKEKAESLGKTDDPEPEPNNSEPVKTDDAADEPKDTEQPNDTDVPLPVADFKPGVNPEPADSQGEPIIDDKPVENDAGPKQDEPADDESPKESEKSGAEPSETGERVKISLGAISESAPEVGESDKAAGDDDKDGKKGDDADKPDEPAATGDIKVEPAVAAVVADDLPKSAKHRKSKRHPKEADKDKDVAKSAEADKHVLEPEEEPKSVVDPKEDGASEAESDAKVPDVEVAAEVEPPVVEADAKPEPSEPTLDADADVDVDKPDAKPESLEQVEEDIKETDEKVEDPDAKMPLPSPVADMTPKAPEAPKSDNESADVPVPDTATVSASLTEDGEKKDETPESDSALSDEPTETDPTEPTPGDSSADTSASTEQTPPPVPAPPAIPETPFVEPSAGPTDVLSKVPTHDESIGAGPDDPAHEDTAPPPDSQPPAAPEAPVVPGVPDTTPDATRTPVSDTASASGPDAPAPPPIPVAEGPAEAAVAAVTTNASKPPLKPETHPRPINGGPKLIAAVLGAVVFFALVGTAFAYSVLPQAALASYLSRLATSTTGAFSVRVTESGASFDASLAVNGSYDVTTAGNPKLIAGLSGSTAANPAAGTANVGTAGPVSAQAVLLDKTLYFKAVSLAQLSQLVPTKLATNWYKVDLSSSQPTTCASPAGWLNSKFVSNVPVTNSKFDGLVAYDDYDAMHYSGTIDASKLQSALDNASSGCQIKGDFGDLSITYDLYRGTSKDSLVLNLTNSSDHSSEVITITTTNYNQPQSITLPSAASAAKTLSSSVLGDSTHRTLAQATSSDPQVDNAKRVADVAQYAAAYRATAQGGFLPTTPAAISFSASDPTTGQPYVVTSGAPGTLGQIQYLAGGVCNGTPVTPGKTATRHVALYIMLESVATPYCLDVN
jgi:hypothetical protein